MIVQSTSALFSAAEIARSRSPRQASTAALPGNNADTVRISQAARDALATTNGDTSVGTRLAEIGA